MSIEKLVALATAGLVAIVLIIIVVVKLSKRLKPDHFTHKWSALQKRCSDKKEWSIALREADDLLDVALKKKRVKGRSMGERLVEAQNMFTDNDAVWYAHKLRKKIDTEADLTLKKEEVQRALLAFRTALRDVGML